MPKITDAEEMQNRHFCPLTRPKLRCSEPVVKAQMAELVDAQVSGTCTARCGGSSPLLGTIFFPLSLRKPNKNGFLICHWTIFGTVSGTILVTFGPQIVTP
jgi:hypothetical protein